MMNTNWNFNGKDWLIIALIILLIIAGMVHVIEEIIESFQKIF